MSVCFSSRFAIAMFAMSLFSQCAEAQQGAGVMFDRILQRRDSNQDGKLQKSEFGGPEQLFHRLDLNKDDVVTRDEFAKNFNPTRDRPNDALPEDVTLLRDVVFGTGGGRELKMHILLPKQERSTPSPVFVWVHGGGWQAGNKEGGIRQVAEMVQLGYVGATIEYRLTGEAPFPAQIEDCKCAIRYLRAHADKYKLDPLRIAVGGSSAGGHLVALLGTSGGVQELEGTGGWADQSSKVQAVIDLYGPTDFQQFVTTNGYEHHNRDGSPESKLLGGGEVTANPDGIKRVNPITYIDEHDPPFLIFHGSDDPVVPLNQSESLLKALQAAKVNATLHILQGAKHGGPQFGTAEVHQQQREFLNSLFSPKP